MREVNDFALLSTKFAEAGRGVRRSRGGAARLPKRSARGGAGLRALKYVIVHRLPTDVDRARHVRTGLRHARER